MSQVLDEITDVPVENQLSLSSRVMGALLGIVGEAMEYSVTFPLKLIVTDMTGYCLEMSMAGPGIWPEVIAKRDPLNLGERRFLFPFDIAVHDAEGKNARISVLSDIFERRISLIKHNTLLVQ